MTKVYYKDVDLLKREYKVINNKKKYIPLNIFIYEKDVRVMLDDMYKFYSKARREMQLLYKNNKEALITDKDYINYGLKKYDILRLKSSLKNGSYKNYIIEINKKYNEKPSKNNYTRILYYLSVDGFIPHIDTLEII